LTRARLVAWADQLVEVGVPKIVVVDAVVDAALQHVAGGSQALVADGHRHALLADARHELPILRA